MRLLLLVGVPIFLCMTMRIHRARTSEWGFWLDSAALLIVLLVLVGIAWIYTRSFAVR